MSELTWEQNREQLNRQLAWQQVRNDFYGNMRYAEKNSAAHSRALDRNTSGSDLSREKHRADQERRSAECMDAHTFYNTVVVPHDAKIKQAQRDGNSTLHRQLLDEANEIITEMLNHTNLALTHHSI